MVRITWLKPDYDGGTPLLGYKIKIQSHDLSFVEQLLYCDGRD